MQADKLKTGAEHVKSKGGGGKFTPSIYWKEDQESHYLAFITPVADFITLDVHVVETKNSDHDRQWRTFVCRKNEAFEDESDGKCELCDVHGDTPSRQTYALAAELEPIEERVGGRKVLNGLQVKMIERDRDDGTTREYPRIGVVAQKPGNFYSYFTTYDASRGDITTVSFEVIRDGKGTKTKYQIFDIRDIERPDLTEFEPEFPNLIDFISELGSEERYAEELIEVWVRKRDNKKSGGSSSSKPSSRTEREPVEAAEEENDTSFEALKDRLERRR